MKFVNVVRWYIHCLVCIGYWFLSISHLYTHREYVKQKSWQSLWIFCPYHLLQFLPLNNQIHFINICKVCWQILHEQLFSVKQNDILLDPVNHVIRMSYQFKSLCVSENDQMENYAPGISAGLFCRKVKDGVFSSVEMWTVSVAAHEEAFGEPTNYISLPRNTFSYTPLCSNWVKAQMSYLKTYTNMIDLELIASLVNTLSIAECWGRSGSRFRLLKSLLIPHLISVGWMHACFSEKIWRSQYRFLLSPYLCLL